MSFNEKVLIVGTVDTEIYLCPATFSGSMHGLVFSNITGADVTVALKHYSQASGQITVFANALKVAANTPLAWPKPINLVAGDKLICAASAANAVTVLSAVYLGSSAPAAAGLTPRGTYTDQASYVLNDVVTLAGTSYINVAPCIGVSPPAANWMILSLKGEKGDQGLQGIQGVKGDAGLQGIQGVKGDTGSAPSTDVVAEGATNKYFTAPRVLSTALAGLSVVTNQVIAATDTVLQAIGYLQKQISDAVTSIATKQANLVSGTNIKTVNSTSLLGGGDVVVGYANIPQNSQSAAYTLTAADANKHVLHPSADTTARTVTIPANSVVAFPIGTAITFVNQASAGVLTIAITSDVMRLAGTGTTGSRTLAANGLATALKITSTEWIISGAGLT
ncbi:hypothetical protein ACO0LM_10590 [Undibacterium sp. Di26W]|uniref:hypothetical protein n=1 Tax=Undibacterium sp. Di26W TaxID=3413035 RepID=UPI003BF39B3E